ncbi:MAG: S8 family serine peptidase, partial [Thermoplasmata archaeon]
MRFGQSAVCALLVWVLLISGILTAPYEENAPESALFEEVETTRSSETAEQLDEDLLLNVDSALDFARNSKAMQNVVIVTSDVAELARTLEKFGYNGLVGTSDWNGLAFPVLEIPGLAIDEVASLPSTLSVLKYLPPEPHRAESIDTFSSDGGMAPTNLNSSINHGVQAAWDRGWNGTGVKIAVIDDGVDFAHPELFAKAMRFDVSVVDPEILADRPHLQYYDGWPMAFDPASLAAYILNGGYPFATDATESWFANTTSTDRNVTHTVRIDGRNDFWTDGSELVATDSNSDITLVPPIPADEGNDFNLFSLYVAQDKFNWYFGFNTLTNQTNVSFGLYINTTLGGADDDPAGKYINAVAEHAPEFAVYMTHNGLQPKGRWDKNDTIENATVYKWDGSIWDGGINITEESIRGNISYSGWDFEDQEAFVEFSIPKKYIGDPAEISVQLFSCGVNASHAMDTVYSDVNVDFTKPEWDTSITTLSAFTVVGRGFWRHTYTRPDDTVEGRPNTDFSWPLEYIVTNTSKSGDYLFADHPDENYPLSRVLVVDEAQPHVYDTVYVDLDHNKDFQNDKPIKKLGKYDSNMVWHPTDWIGQGTIYDETCLADFFDPIMGVSSVDWSPDGTRIASGSLDHTVIVWDAADGSTLSYLNAHMGRVRDVQWSPTDANRLAAAYDDRSGNGDNNVVIWNTATEKIEKVLVGHASGVKSIAWAPSGNELVSGSLDGTVKVWDIASETSMDLTAYTDGVTSVDWSFLDRIASASLDDTILIHDSGGTLIRSFSYSSPTAIAFNPNGTRLAIADGNGALIVRNVVGPAEGSPEYAHGLAKMIMDVSWSSDGTLLLTTSNATFVNDMTLVLWNVTYLNNYTYKVRVTGAHDELVSGELTKRWVGGADFAPNATWIVTGGQDRKVKLWEYLTAPFDDLVSRADLSEHTIGSLDYTRWNTGDGIADVSGGIVYFIAQNYWDAGNQTLIRVPIPYSDVYVKRNGLIEQQVIPENGTLIAFMGALDLDFSHGTLIASSIVGRGISTFFDDSRMDEPSEPQVMGFAPEAEILPIANIYYGSYIEGWLFAIEGYDGEPNTGDEANIVSNSFGFPGTYEAGLDFWSRFLDWLVNNRGDNKVVFTVSAGNAGHGYGTVTTPATSTGVVSVGSSTDFQYRRISGLENGMNPNFGEIATESGRGPSALGRPEPDVVTNGRMAFGATPLNQVQYRPYDGTRATDLWAGTSLASPCTASILALIYQAYKHRHGVFPDATTAQSILMSSADDLSYDVLSQGAGRTNADRATKIAHDEDGFVVSPNFWVPGDYKGTKYEAFPRLIRADETDTQDFLVTNHNSTGGEEVLISDAVFKRIDTVNYSFTTGSENEAVWTVIRMMNVFQMEDPGVYDSFGMKIADISVTNWLETDLLKVTVYTNQSLLDTNLDGTTDKSYFLDIYDWTWRGGGMANPAVASYNDLNRMLIAYPDANIYEGRIHNPAQRTHDGLVIGVRPGIQAGKPGAPDVHFKVALDFYKKQDWNWLSTSTDTLTLNSLGSPGDSDTFTATMTVGSDATVGSYEGAIYLRGDVGQKKETFINENMAQLYARPSKTPIKTATVWRDGMPQTEGVDYTLYPETGIVYFTNLLSAGTNVTIDYEYYNVTTIPVLVNVPSDVTQFQFGGFPAGQDDLYGNMVHGGFGNGKKSGDWRYYFVDVPDEGQFKNPGSVKFLLDIVWDYDMTDINAFAFGRGGLSQYGGAAFEVPRYGPYLFYKNYGGSEETTAVFTTTGGNQEIVAPTIIGGLDVIAIQHRALNGTVHEETVSGNVNTMEVIPSILSISTNNLSGNRDVYIHSATDWQGISGVSAGPALPVELKNVTVFQDKTDGASFNEILSKAKYTKIVLVKPSALIFDVHITSDRETTAKVCPDLDLGIFLDGKGTGNIPDGEAQPEEFITLDADSDADEHIRLIRPTAEDDPDTAGINEAETGAPYLIKVLGYSVFAGSEGTFNMDISLVQGEGFEIEGTTTDLVPAGTITKVSLKWNLAGSTEDSQMLGALYVGPAIAPLTVLVPVELNLDRVAPVMTGFTIQSSTNMVNYTGQIKVTEGDIGFSISVSDPKTAVYKGGELDLESAEVWFDGVNITSLANVLIPFDAGPKDEDGYWGGTLSYIPLAAIPEGVHNITFAIRDIAGNLAQQTFHFTVDSSAPMISVDQPAMFHTQEDRTLISGVVDRGSTITIRDEEVPVDSDGRFERTVTLTPGENFIVVEAVDWFATDEHIPANYAAVYLTVISDSLQPSMDLEVQSTTNAETLGVRGQVEDLISPLVSNDLTTLSLRIAGIDVPVQSDGSFYAVIPLPLEGENNITFLLSDPAGNTASENRWVTRDTTPPALTLESVPETTTSNTVRVRGTAEAGSTV